MINLKPVGFVKNNRKEVKDDYWGSVISEVILLLKGKPVKCF